MISSLSERILNFSFCICKLAITLRDKLNSAKGKKSEIFSNAPLRYYDFLNARVTFYLMSPLF